jgi:hypothetical protein
VSVTPTARLTLVDYTDDEQLTDDALQEIAAALAKPPAPGADASATA